MSDLIEFQKLQIESLQKEIERLNKELKKAKKCAFELTLSDQNFDRPINQIKVY